MRQILGDITNKNLEPNHEGKKKEQTVQKSYGKREGILIEDCSKELFVLWRDFRDDPGTGAYLQKHFPDDCYPPGPFADEETPSVSTDQFLEESNSWVDEIRAVSGITDFRADLDFRATFAHAADGEQIQMQPTPYPATYERPTPRGECERRSSAGGTENSREDRRLNTRLYHCQLHVSFI